MATINDVAEALISIIRSQTGIPATQIRLKPQTPSVMVYPDTPMLEGDSSAYYETFGGGLIGLRMCVEVVASAVNVDGQQRWLNDVVGPFGSLSIPHAILKNPTLGTDVNEATGGTPTMTASCGKPTVYELALSVDGSMTYLHSKLPVTVMTRGDR